MDGSKKQPPHNSNSNNKNRSNYNEGKAPPKKRRKPSEFEVPAAAAPQAAALSTSSSSCGLSSPAITAQTTSPPTKTLPSNKSRKGAGKSASKQQKKQTGGDPLPSRPLNAYNMFFREQRDLLLRERDSQPPEKKLFGACMFAAMGKTIADRWNRLRPEFKFFYQELAAKDKERYLVDVEIYKLKQRDAMESALAATSAATASSSASATASSSSFSPSVLAAAASAVPEVPVQDAMVATEQTSQNVFCTIEGEMENATGGSSSAANWTAQGDGGGEAAGTMTSQAGVQGEVSINAISDLQELLALLIAAHGVSVHQSRQLSDALLRNMTPTAEQEEQQRQLPLSPPAPQPCDPRTIQALLAQHLVMSSPPPPTMVAAPASPQFDATRASFQTTQLVLDALQQQTHFTQHRPPLPQDEQEQELQMPFRHQQLEPSYAGTSMMNMVPASAPSDALEHALRSLNHHALLLPSSLSSSSTLLASQQNTVANSLSQAFFPLSLLQQQLQLSHINATIASNDGSTSPAPPWQPGTMPWQPPSQPPSQKPDNPFPG